MRWTFNPEDYVEREDVKEEESTVYGEPEEEYMPESDPVWDSFVRESKKTRCKTERQSLRSQISPEERIATVIVCLVSNVDNKDAYMTREEVGKYLQYANPTVSISAIHRLNADAFDRLSEKREIITQGRVYEKVFYSPEGVCEIISYSRQPMAGAFLRGVAQALKQKTGSGGEN